VNIKREMEKFKRTFKDASPNAKEYYVEVLQELSNVLREYVDGGFDYKELLKRMEKLRNKNLN
jgi:hypothetical protein